MKTDSILPTLYILGGGRLGTVLAQSCMKKNVPLLGIWNRRKHLDRDPTLPWDDSCLNDLMIHNADIIILAITDDALSHFVELLAQTSIFRSGQTILHCSGSQASAILKPLEKKGCSIGSFHPFQPITVNKSFINFFEGIYIGIEGGSVAQQKATQLALFLGGQPFSLEKVDRDLYHAAAVFASNYLVTLAQEAQKILKVSGVQVPDPLELLLPLLEQTVSNIKEKKLPNALTGPISRGDTTCIKNHMNALQASSASSLLPLYRLLASHTLQIAQENRNTRRSLSSFEALQTLLQNDVDQKNSQR